MAILWMGGEDIDFPNGGLVSITNAYRSGYARCGIYSQGGNAPFIKSTTFPGGAITSCWLSFRFFYSNLASSPYTRVGLGQSGSNSGLFIGLNFGTVNLCTWNGTTQTVLASANAISQTSAMHKFDVQLASYGASSTVTVYLDGNQIISYSGSTSITGVTGFDSIFIGASEANGGASEIIVANESTLAFQGLVTMAPNANGTTQQWSNPAYTNINPTAINDANATYVNATGDDEQVGLVAIPSGQFTIKAVKTNVRAMASSGSASTNIKVGFNNGSTVAVNPSHAVGASFAEYEDYFTTDPTTGAAWASLSGYQLDLRSA